MQLMSFAWTQLHICFFLQILASKLIACYIGKSSCSAIQYWLPWREHYVLKTFYFSECAWFSARSSGRNNIRLGVLAPSFNFIKSYDQEYVIDLV